MSRQERPGSDRSTAEAPDESREHGRGRGATSPAEIPRRGWRDILLRVKEEIGRDSVGLVAAGIAFYALLALPPMLAALIAVYGLVADPASVQDLVDGLANVPEDVRQVISDQLTRVTSASSQALGIGFAISLVLALWSASKGTKAVIEGLNIAYDEEDRRGFLRLNAISLGLTFLALVAGALALATVAGVPVLLERLGLSPVQRIAAALVPYAVLIAVFLGMLALFYRYGPHREDARWAWITPGSVAATVLWLVASLAFSFYVARFGSYNETYGSLGAIAVLLMWLWISGYVVVLGAELNAEMEHQTARDTTTDPEKPMGERGAHVADTVGHSR